MNKQFFNTSLMSYRGQVSLIMILIFALGLIFFAVSLNWGRMAQIKTQTLIGANTGAMASASILASSAESQWQQTLDGDLDKDGLPSHCDNTSIWMAIVGVLIAIIAIVLAPFTGAASLYLLVLAYAALAMAVVNIALQVFVVQPGIVSMWNKLQARLQPDAYFMEQGITTAAQSIVTDSGQVPDLFDMNMDGQFYGSLSGQGKDEVSRYGFYYTERLKMLQPPALDDAQLFVSHLKALTFGDASQGLDCSLYPSEMCCLPIANRPTYGCGWQMTKDLCTDPNDARCNQCCLPAYQKIPNPFLGQYKKCIKAGINPFLCTQPELYKKIRSDTCSTDVEYKPSDEYFSSVPPNDTISNDCKLTSKNPYATDFPYVYDSTYPDFQSTNFSFMKFLGQDVVAGMKGGSVYDYGKPVLDSTDKPGTYSFGSPAVVQGDVFPMLWNMKDKITITAAENTLYNTNGTTLGIVVDKMMPMTNFATADANCPTTSFTDSNPQSWWKPKLDGLCEIISNPPQWPYDDTCNNSRINSNGAQVCAKWHDDALDNLIIQGKEFINFSENMISMTSNDIQQSFTSWYPIAASWIAPQCETNATYCAAHPNEFACMPEVCSEDSEGKLRAWRRTVGGTNGTSGLYGVFNEWVNAPAPASSMAFCLPTSNGSIDTSNMSQTEKDLYVSTNTTTLSYSQKVAKCLLYHQNADEKFAKCKDQCSQENCTNLPRSFVAGFNSNNPSPALPNADKSSRISAIYAQLALNPPTATADQLRTELTGIYSNTSCQAGSIFLDKISQSKDLFLRNETLMTKRTNVVVDTVTKAANARDQFKKAYEVFDGFLGKQNLCDDLTDATYELCKKSPVFKLMKTIKEYQAQAQDVNNFFIYGWKGPRYATSKDSNNNINKRQYWHMVRVEVKIPKRCPGKLCGAGNRIPYVKAKKESIFKMCYILKGYPGKAMVRVTRWDEDHDNRNVLQFMNKVRLWKFSSNNPFIKAQATDETVSQMEQICAGNECSGQDEKCSKKPPVGMTAESWDTIVNELELPDDAKAKFRNAFMVNLLKGNLKTMTTTNANSMIREQNCLAVADKFLRRGTTSTACAEYYFRKDEKRMAVRFIKCPDQAYLKDCTDHLSRVAGGNCSN